MIRIIGYVVGGVVVLVVVATILFYLRAQMIDAPENVNNGEIDPCPETPNCVSTLDTDEEHGIEPIAYSGSMDEARARLVTVLEDLPRTTVMTEQDTYVYAVSRSPTMGFPDDLEFVFDDEAKVINLRSAARMGQSDLGKNRERIETIRSAFNRE